MSGKAAWLDRDVLVALHERAEPFEDVNSVLRRVLGLPPASRGPVRVVGDEQMIDPRVTGLVAAVEKQVDRKVVVERKKQSWGLKPERGRRIAFVYAQRRRLKVEVPKELAEKAGCLDWAHVLVRGWFDTDDAVWWFVEDGNQSSLEHVSRTLGRIMRLDQ